ncbi:MAG TPA: hypothetical protein VF507_00420 [Pyrinomonadaceae bacterium]|jgi:hypothetical protein
MTKTRAALLIVFLLVPLSAFAQGQRSVRAEANRNWQGFWTKFSRAMKQRDHEALKSMVSDDFFDGGGGGTAADYIKEIDLAKSWRAHQRSVALGTRPYRYRGRPARVTKNDHLFFEFGKDGQWRWAGMVGD